MIDRCSSQVSFGANKFGPSQNLPTVPPHLIMFTVTSMYAHPFSSIFATFLHFCPFHPILLNFIHAHPFYHIHLLSTILIDVIQIRDAHPTPPRETRALPRPAPRKLTKPLGRNGAELTLDYTDYAHTLKNAFVWGCLDGVWG